MFALSKHHPGVGAWWKRKVERKLKRRSATDGRTKGPKCKASTQDRYMTKTSRSYKHRDYKEWCERKNGT